MSESGKVFAKLQKQHGERVVRTGSSFPNVERVPCGVFPLDLAIGGGFPRGRIIILYGVESSGKSLVAMKLAAQVQARGETVVYVDVEHTFDPTWVSALGVDVKKLIVVSPDNAEMVVNVVEAMLYAKDVGLVIVDSIAAMIGEKEASSDAERVQVGGSSIIVQKMVNKSVIALSKEEERKHFPMLLAVNQIRIKVGQMFGDPETFPGGNALKFASSLTVRLYGKNVMDKAIHTKFPAYKATSGTVKKWKIPINRTTFEYNLLLVPNNGLPVGETESWDTAANYLKSSLDLAKGKKGIVCMGETFPTLAAVEKRYREDDIFRSMAQSRVFELASSLEDAATETEEENG